MSERKTKKIGDREVPIIPPLPPERDRPTDPNPIVAVCGECGIELRQVMHYSCSNSRCPIVGGGYFAQ